MNVKSGQIASGATFPGSGNRLINTKTRAPFGTKWPQYLLGRVVGLEASEVDILGLWSRFCKCSPPTRSTTDRGMLFLQDSITYPKSCIRPLVVNFRKVTAVYLFPVSRIILEGLAIPHSDETPLFDS